MRATKKAMQGLSMIEVLVTVVILALGILGTSALQITALKGTDAAHYRTVATFLANEMAERIRMNTTGVELGGYETDLDNPIVCDNISSDTLDCNSTSCTASQLPLFDQTQLTCGHVNRTGSSWQTAIKGGAINSLPNGSIVVSCGEDGCGADTDHIITVAWTERADREEQVVAASSVVLEITP